MGGPNYMMIRRAICGKVHGRGVKEIWLISQFPTKHKGVASGPKIVFAHPGLARLLAPKWLHFAFQRPISYCMTLSDQILCPWGNTGDESVHKQIREKHDTWACTSKTFLAIGKIKKELLKILKWNVISNFTLSPFEKYCESDRMKVRSKKGGGSS